MKGRILTKTEDGSVMEGPIEDRPFKEWYNMPYVVEYMPTKEDKEEFKRRNIVSMTCKHCGYEWEYELVYGFRDPDDKICPRCGKK